MYTLKHITLFKQERDRSAYKFTFSYEIKISEQWQMGVSLIRMLSETNFLKIKTVYFIKLNMKPPN